MARNAANRKRISDLDTASNRSGVSSSPQFSAIHPSPPLQANTVRSELISEKPLKLDDKSTLSKIVMAPPLDSEYRDSVQREIADLVIRKSKTLKNRNFELIGTRDLSFMAELYDEFFLDSTCLRLARKDGLTFRWSRRMTSAGGKTTRTVWPPTRRSPGKKHYEIALSSSLLFQTFRDVDRPVRVCGRLCVDRMEAMQRILEHEMIHLIEMLVWIDSNCAAAQFQGIAGRMFGHTEHRHELITQRERAVEQFNIRLGMKVQFLFEGKPYHGVVNRITRRATVLVEDPKGILFSDGRRYRKFYVPLAQLRQM